MHLEAALKFGPAFIYNVPGRTGQDWLFQQEHLLPFLNVNLSILDAAGHQARCDHENQRSSELHRCQGLVKREEPSGEEMFMVLVARVRRNSVVRQECMGHERIKESCLRRRKHSHRRSNQHLCLIQRTCPPRGVIIPSFFFQLYDLHINNINGHPRLMFIFSNQRSSTPEIDRRR